MVSDMCCGLVYAASKDQEVIQSADIVAFNLLSLMVLKSERVQGG